MQQHPRRRVRARGVEQRAVLQRPGHRAFECLLRLRQPAHVFVGGRGLLGDVLPHRGRLDVRHRGLEVTPGDGHVTQVHRTVVTPCPPERGQCRLRRQCVHVGTDEPVGAARQPVQVDVVVCRHPSGVDLEDLPPPGLAGDADLDLPVEPPPTPERRVERVRTVRRPDDDHVLAGVQPVHQRQQLPDHPILHVAAVVALAGDGVDLVEEDDRRGVLVCLLEPFPEAFLTLTLVLGGDLRAGHGDELRVHLVGDRLCDQRLPGAGWAVQQHPLRRFDPQPGEHLRLGQGKLDRLPHQIQLVV